MMMPWTGGWWVFPPVMLLGIVVVAFLIVRTMGGTLFPARRGHLPAASGGGEEDEDGDEDRALSILRQRYALGEIELDEYERMVEPLLRHEPGRRTRL